MKRCYACKQMKPPKGFHRDRTRRDGRDARCRACRQPDPEAIRARNLKHRYGLTIEEYDAMHDRAGGCCEACGDSEPPDHQRRFLQVDHCHDSGRVRGLLCFACNIAIGKAKDDPVRLTRMADYLAERG